MSSMYVFARKWGSPICRVFLTVQNTHRRALLFIDNRQFIGFFTQTKLSSIYRHKLYCHLLGLDKTSSVTYNSGETQTYNNFFYFSVEIDSGEILASVLQEERNFEVLKRCYIRVCRTGWRNLF